ncbi:Rho family GTPase RHO5 NDAI_0F03360 [Naumovozyma dairenensis CBS 421]|uniref:Uncharacterized protein n=1 Tax=Naumovozyma dairenensis (strain ATCC 10597 / BCRC 20456 / CBS 421 / NBRC 0211 / NRRL Y-12639) TaxID=1071378 RepID=G0WCZ3_NAUDC|nr:hypothetical protein NDAI_0F03360 [Naumovozyma dairenensis CBS 421]CCD25654.1 hypothetical protein NDAI_0F03360 [Naumovozyma dairenensis CBS 421]
MHNIKICVIGDGAVGKTCLLISYTTNTFPQDYVPTVFDNYSTTVSLTNPYTNISTDSNSNASSSENKELFKLNLWDTAGQEEYDRLRPLSYPQTSVFLVCFSVAEPSSFENVFEKWIPELKQSANIENSQLYLNFGKLPILLVGTKSDLRDDESTQDKLQESGSDFISLDQINERVKKAGLLGYVECSAATQSGIREVFEKAIELVVFAPEHWADEKERKQQETERVKVEAEKKQKAKEEQARLRKNKEIKEARNLKLKKPKEVRSSSSEPDKRLSKSRSKDTANKSQSKSNTSIKTSKKKKSKGDCVIL